MRLFRIFSFSLPAVLSASAAACGGSSESPEPPSACTSDASILEASSPIDAHAPDAPSVTTPEASTPDAPLDAGTGDSASLAIAVPLPQIRNVGGGVLPVPRIVPIVYADDDATTRGKILDFLTKLPETGYWANVVKEYGITGATVAAPVIVSDPAPTTIDDSAIQTWMAGHLNDVAGGIDAGADSGTSAWPAADGNSIYIVFYPTGTSVTFSNPPYPPSVSCTDFGAYHGEVPLAAGSTTYAVIPRCNGYLGQSGLNFVTGAASHELLEAASDPFPTSAPAYDDTDFNGSGWELNAGGPEIGDLCKLEVNAFVVPAGFDYSVQRMWSDEHAAAGHEPCFPNVPDAGAYFTAFPDLEGVEAYPGYYISGVNVQPGTSRTIDIHLASDAPTGGPWTVSATEQGSPQAPPDPDHLLSFTWDKTTGVSGDVVHLTIKREPTPNTTSTHGLPLVISSKLGGETNSFWTMVGE